MHSGEAPRVNVMRYRFASELRRWEARVRDDWYLVSRPRGDDKGWVYRQAIGK